MTKKEYLIECLVDQAHVISVVAKTASPKELADDVIRFMSIIHLCGQEDLLAAATPKEAADSIQNHQDELTSGFDGDWSSGGGPTQQDKYYD